MYTSIHDRHVPTSPLAMVAALLLVGICITEAQSAEPWIVRDIGLAAGGVLEGSVVDRAGQPVAGAAVALITEDTEVSRTTSRPDGRFAFGGLTPGIYQCGTPDDIATCRVWAPGSAPPAARSALLLRAGNAVVRGQCGCWSRNVHCGGCGCCGDSKQTTASPLAAPPAPQLSMDELRELAPDLPAEQFAALTRADVVIINPEHISVAIQYNPASGAATVVAKGGDELALQMRSVARGAGVPVVANPELAQALFAQVAVGGLVPPELLGQVADIVAGLSPAVEAPVFEPAAGEFQASTATGLANPRIAVGVAIVTTAIVVPLAVSNDDTDDRPSGS